MALSGGDIVEITINHEDYGYRAFSGKSSEDSTYQLGGLRSSDDSNSIQGNGVRINKLNMTTPEFSVKVGWDMTSADLEYMNNVASSPKEAAISITNVNQIIYSMTGNPVGMLEANGNSSTFDLKFQGSGKMQVTS